MPRYLRAIQVPSGALISTQISIMIFFLELWGLLSVGLLTFNMNRHPTLWWGTSGKKMLPAGLLLVLEGFLGVIGGAGRVFYRTLNMGINPEQSQLKFKISKTNTCSPSRLGFPQERRCPWTFRAAPWSTAPAWWTSHACQTDGLVTAVIKKSAPLLDVVDGRP